MWEEKKKNLFKHEICSSFSFTLFGYDFIFFPAIFSFKILLSCFHSPFFSAIRCCFFFRRTPNSKKAAAKWKLFRNLKLNWLKKFPTHTLLFSSLSLSWKVQVDWNRVLCISAWSVTTPTCCLGQQPRREMRRSNPYGNWLHRKLYELIK